jgi:hypothetical protein
MPGCSPLQVIAISDQAAALLPQTIEKMEVRSSRSRWRTAAARGEVFQLASPDPADFAGRSATAQQARYLEWMTPVLPRTSTDLVPRLPFGDAIKLAALVGTGRMTWPEINAALDAMMKLATADALDEQGAWEETTQDGEAAIWARYHAQCDEVFASDAEDSDAGSWSHEQLWSRERTLDRLRSARDRELAALRRRSASPATTLKSSQTPAPRTQLTAAESDALDKLYATGFVASEDMMTAIDRLVGEIAGSAVPLNEACAVAPACRS